MSSKGTDEERVMHSRSDNIEIVIDYEAEEFIKELFESLLFRYQVSLETSMKGSDFIFDYVDLLRYNCHRINLISCINYLLWIKSKK